jgi:hypothetical protein
VVLGEGPFPLARLLDRLFSSCSTRTIEPRGDSRPGRSVGGRRRRHRRG